ncbi:hypothetical protein [Paenibacillus sp. OSY-SE]|nr:hypothetical protein [Paenibacillus sp. OSY-SE]
MNRKDVYRFWAVFHHATKLPVMCKSLCRPFEKQWNPNPLERR